MVTVCNKLILTSQSLDKFFLHIWFLSFITCLGKLAFLPIFYLRKPFKRHKKNTLIPSHDEHQHKTDINLFSLILPALCDLTATTLFSLGLRFISGSVFKMFTVTGIIFTQVISYFVLQNYTYRHHVLGIFVVCIGLVLIGYSTINEVSIEISNIIIGLILTVLGQFFISLQFIIEELIMRKHKCHPIKAVGYEGLWAIIIMFFLLIIFEFIPCSQPDGKSLSYYLCNVDEHGNYYVETTIYALKQMGGNILIFVNVVLFGVGYNLMVYSGISFSNYSSAAARTVIDTLRTILIWVFFMMPFIELEFREHFLWLQLIGFIFLIIGNLIYNEMISLPCFNLNYYTKEKILEREKHESDPSNQEKASKKNELSLQEVNA